MLVLITSLRSLNTWGAEKSYTTGKHGEYYFVTIESKEELEKLKELTLKKRGKEKGKEKSLEC